MQYPLGVLGEHLHTQAHREERAIGADSLDQGLANALRIERLNAGTERADAGKYEEFGLADLGWISGDA